ncbi:MAG: glycosyltransferase family 2 protein [Fibrobacter sp.]|nr:glycosyltransferase family 2 protein [Fibrobacter sp.]
MERDVFIFVPAYNVQSTIADVLSKISPAMRARSKVLVIDDGSLPAIEVLAATNVVVHRFSQNQGYGAVVKFGIAAGLAAGAKYIACLHGDGQYPAEKLDEFIAELDRCGLALLQGSRHAVAGAARSGGMPLYKRIGGAVLTAIENIAFRQKLTDRHSGFIVYSAEFLKTVNLDKLSPSFDIDLELISIADSRGFAIGELPIPTRYAGEKSNLNVVSYGFRVLRQTFRRLVR